jgi:hypothetical protein
VRTTSRMTLAAVLSLSLAAPALAAEDVVEHETYEKRSLKIETGPAAASTTTTLAPRRVYEHHDESESTTVKQRSITPPPAAVVKERTTDSVETMEKN